MLENAIAKVCKLPESIQDQAAERLMEYVDELPADSERVSIEEAREAYANGDFMILSKWKRDLGIDDKYRNDLHLKIASSHAPRWNAS